MGGGGVRLRYTLHEEHSETADITQLLEIYTKPRPNKPFASTSGPNSFKENTSLL